ncbi:hypothetical protein Tco_0884704 [Tanacetum coccineum]
MDAGGTGAWRKQGGRDLRYSNHLRSNDPPLKVTQSFARPLYGSAELSYDFLIENQALNHIFKLSQYRIETAVGKSYVSTGKQVALLRD